MESLPDYLRGVAAKWTNPDMGSERKSLRAFVDFERMYRASNNLELSAQVVFPDTWQQMADVMLVDKTKAGS